MELKARIITWQVISLMLSLVVYLPASSNPALSELDPVTILAEPIPSASLNASTANQNQFSGQTLLERGMTTYNDLNRQIANFHFIDAGVGSYTQGFSLRGLTNTDIFSDPAVVIYIDDVPYSNAGTVMSNWLNAETVTVYRGPEPGRLGKNAYAGAIVINSKQPSNTLRTALSYEAGTYAQQKVTTTVSGALVNNQLYASFSGEYQARDAFLYNSYLNTTPDEQEHVSGQAMLKWLPNSTFDIRLIVTQQDFDYGATRWVNLASPDFFTVTSNVDEQLEQQADSQALRIAYTGDDYQWLSVSSRRYWSMNPNVEDFDLTPEPLLREQTLSEQAYSQEWRLQPKAFNSTWDWQIGLFYSHIEKQGVVNSWFYDIFVQNALKQRNTNQYSAFGQVVYQDFQRIKPYLALRIDSIDSDVEAANIYPDGSMLSLQQQETRFFVSPKLGVNVMLTDTINAHASSGLAFKPSGFSIANINTNLSHYNQETTWHNELGITIEEMAGQLSLSFTGFYYAITDYQMERYFTEFDYGIANAAKAHSYGFEAESEWRLNDNLSLQTQIGYTQTRFDTYRDPITDADYAGNMAPFIPETNGLLALQYQHSQGYFARAEWQFTGTTYFDDSNTALMRQNSYDLAHLRIGYEHKPFSAYAFVSNLGDNRYYTSKFLGVSGVPGEPRLIGVKLTVDF